MIKWYDKKEQKLNIKDIIKVIDILPCSWSDGYYDYNGKYNLITPVPVADGNYLIYSIKRHQKFNLVPLTIQKNVELSLLF